MSEFDKMIEEAEFIEERPHLSRVSTFTLRFNFEFDTHFFAIMPSININRHSKSLEFEWLFFGLYIDLI